VTVGGKDGPTTEHYFQTQKFVGTLHEGEVRRAASPTAAARMGRSRARPLRADWERVKDEVMRVAVAAKVRQHPDVREALLSTGDEETVEVAPKNAYWGCGPHGKGPGADGPCGPGPVVDAMDQVDQVDAREGSQRVHAWP